MLLSASLWDVYSDPKNGEDPLDLVRTSISAIRDFIGKNQNDANVWLTAFVNADWEVGYGQFCKRLQVAMTTRGFAIAGTSPCSRSVNLPENTAILIQELSDTTDDVTPESLSQTLVNTAQVLETNRTNTIAASIINKFSQRAAEASE